MLSAGKKRIQKKGGGGKDTAHEKTWPTYAAAQPRVWPRALFFSPSRATTVPFFFFLFFSSFVFPPFSSFKHVSLSFVSALVRATTHYESERIHLSV